MEIIPNASDRQTGRSAAADRSVLAADFQTFLRLLTTQLRNQDPLNPMETTEFATQLATFSGVEQQVRTNGLLETLGTGIGTLGMGQLGGWIGMEAMAEMPVAFTGAPVTLRTLPADRADRLELVVTDAAGSVVQRMPVPLSDTPFVWTGANLQGQSLPPGTYEVAVENWSGEDLIETRAVTVRALIEEARLIDGRVFLSMQGGMSVPADAVQGLRRGDS